MLEIVERLACAEDLQNLGAAAIRDYMLTPILRRKLERHARAMLEMIKTGDELWLMQPEGDCLGSFAACFALVRGGEVVETWH